MKLYLVILLVLLIGADASAKRKSKKKKKAEPVDSPTTVSCSAFAALKIKLIGKGRCKGIAGADCRAVASAQDDFKEAYNTWWSEEGGCEEAELEEAALAIANVCASVYAKTIAKVECKGKGGFACGWAISEGDAYAVAMARAIAQAAVDASSVDADAFCISDVEAISGAVAEAAASAQSDACVKGTGSQEDFQEGFVESVAQALAEALVKATASTCDAKGATAAQSACFGEAKGDTKGDVKKKATKKAKARGSTGSVEMCADAMAKCCATKYRSGLCKCTDKGCAGQWVRRKDFRGEQTRVWAKPGALRVTCQCKLPHT